MEVSAGRDGRDAPIEDGRDADIAGRRHGEAVKILQARHRGDDPSAIEGGGGFDDARTFQIEGPHPARHCIGHVNRLLVRGEANAVRAGIVEVQFLGFARAIGQEEQAAEIAVAGIGLAMIGEIEIAGLVEDEIVRSFQGMAFDRIQYALHLACREIDTFDAAAIIIVRAVSGDQQPVHVGVEEAAIVADPECAVRPDGEAVGAAARSRDHFGLAVAPAARDAFLLDLDDDDAAVGHDDRALGKAESACDDLEFHVAVSSSPFWAGG